MTAENFVMYKNCLFNGRKELTSKAGKQYTKFNFVYQDKVISLFPPLFNDDLSDKMEALKENERYTLCYKACVNRNGDASLQLHDIHTEQ